MHSKMIKKTWDKKCNKALIKIVKNISGNVFSLSEKFKLLGLWRKISTLIQIENECITMVLQ